MESNKYEAVISNKYVAVISGKYVAVISKKYVAVISDKYVAVISDGRTPKNIFVLFCDIMQQKYDCNLTPNNTF